MATKLIEITEQGVEREIKEMRRNSLRSMLNSAIALVIVVPVYIWHFRRARRLS